MARCAGASLRAIKLDVLAHHRAREAQLACGGGEAAVLHNLCEGPHALELVHGEMDCPRISDTVAMISRIVAQ
jgi:hypothetical protein